MTEPHFTHLHVHTDFSLLDGAIQIDGLIQYAKKQNFKALAITDHGNIFGAVQFFQKCKSAKIKPIIGIEAYLTEDCAIKNTENKYYHIILLVQNEIGYKNLCKLISYSFHDGFYFKPRIDYAQLKKYSEGLIATSGCLGGHIPQLLKQNNREEIHKRIDWFLDVFGKERFYLEVQPEDQEEQKIINAQLFELAQERGLHTVATADCHYINEEDREAHEVMLCIQTHGKMSDPDRYTFGNCRVHLRSTQQMLEIFKDHPEAVWNSGKIADMCNFEFETGKLHFPTYQVPENHTQESYFKHLCTQGFERLLKEQYIPENQKEFYQARLDLEADLIISMGFIGYFLVVSDFIQWAKRNGIPVGPGRGSAAGALVAWALEITNIDPIKYNLLFERFLNPERITMPDIDIDFCIEGRERVIDYVREKYGHNNVCQIITFGTMMAKGVIKDVARALSIPFEDANMITSLIPSQLNISLEEAKKTEPKIQELIDNNPQVAHLFSIAEKLEGITRHASKHAAGVVICPEPVDNLLPVYIPAKTNDLVTQYAMTELESLGFLKMDFLGLKTLTLIDRVINMIKKNHETHINIDKLDLDDAKTFKLLGDGKTSGVFQLESNGLKEVLKKLQPNKFEDIIAVNALYRPGPLGSGMVNDYVERRHGRQQVTYLLPELEPILAETYGVIVYQEQVMKIASAVGNYSLGEADILRRAMGKKKAEVMAEQQQIFVEKAKARGTDPDKARELFDLMAYFAGYGFNKSHSAAYALIAYQTAYLKAHYPAEFMAVLISLESDNAEKMSFYLDEAKSMGLTLLPPNINTSEITFSVIKGAVLFGLQGIKNVGLTALNNIIEQRNKKPFIDMLDLCMRIDLRTANKRVLENCIAAGAFDTLPGNRAQKFIELETIIDTAVQKKQSVSTGQMGLFQTITPQSSTSELYTFQPLAEWTDKEKLEKEKEVIGFYLSSHPLDSHKKYLNRLACYSFQSALEEAQRLNTPHDIVTAAYGLLKSKRIITTKKGDKMAFIELEDYISSAEIVLFPSVYKKIETFLDSESVFFVKGTIETSGSRCKILAQEIIPIDQFFNDIKTASHITIITNQEISPTAYVNLKKKFSTGKVPVTIAFTENGKSILLKTKKTISIHKELFDDLEASGYHISLTP